MYKIQLTAVDSNVFVEEEEEGYTEIICKEEGYTHKKDAFMEMVECAMNELNELNGFSNGAFWSDRAYGILLNENGHDVVIKCAYENNNEIEYDITYYDVIRTSKQKETEEINRKLWEEHGEDLTIEIFYDEDEETYYWESSTSGASSYDFETSEEAYESVEDYLYDLEMEYC